MALFNLLRFIMFSLAFNLIFVSQVIKICLSLKIWCCIHAGAFVLFVWVLELNSNSILNSNRFGWVSLNRKRNRRSNREENQKIETQTQPSNPGPTPLRGPNPFSPSPHTRPDPARPSAARSPLTLRTDPQQHAPKPSLARPAPSAA